MYVTVVGGGTVGATVAGCFVEDHHVTVIDTSSRVVETIENGHAPVDEPGLEELYGEVRGTTDMNAVEYSDVVFVCVPEDHAERVVHSIDVRTPHGFPVFMKSTVDVGTCRELHENTGCYIISNPEFLRDGSAVEDFQNPDRVVVGGPDTDLAFEFYDGRIVQTSWETAELAKLACNSFLATKLSYVNDVGNLAKETGADMRMVSTIMGMDDRIDDSFLGSGLGFGGPCLPKDAKKLDTRMARMAVSINNTQPFAAMLELSEHITLDGATVAILGLAFKPGTSTDEGSQSYAMKKALELEGAKTVTHDPEVPSDVDDVTDALENADAAVVCTAWPEYESLPAAAMRTPVVLDCRDAVKDISGLEYTGLHW